MTAYLLCIITFCELWTCCKVYSLAETILGYNTQAIDATRISVIPKNFVQVTKILI